MATMTDVRDAVIGALCGAFPDLPIYAEEIKQGLVEPCFFVKDFPVAHSHLMGKRYARSYGFDVHYFPASDIEPNEECQGVAEQLTEVLELMQASGGKLRGTGMRAEIVAGVLHFIFTINVHLIKQTEPVPPMETATVKERIK